MTEIALISDVHMRDGYASRIRDELEDVVDSLAERSPSRAFVLGDLIEDGASAATDRANVERVSEALADAPFPVTYLLGNHDVDNLTRKTLSNCLGQERFYGVVAVDGTPVVYLDSALEGCDGPQGKLGPGQRAWLADTLPEYDRPVLLVHHPLGNFDISDNEWFEEYPERAFLGDRKETLDVVEAAGPVRGTVSGHIHQTDFSTFRGLSHASINAFSKELPNKPLTGTFAEVDVSDGVDIDVGTRSGVTASYTFD